MHLVAYSRDNLALAISNQYTSKDVIEAKNHFLYLIDYLESEEINARTILIEENYVSKDFLDDYSSYYSSCFENYPKFCKRVHFFSKSVSEPEFHSIALGLFDENSDFWEHYLGFVVVKPIPVTVIGYTVLKTYATVEGTNDRYFWGIRDYPVHLYGNKVTIRSLAFQEQDTVLAACATTAIWSMLNKASVDFHTTLKSPSHITKDADRLSHNGSRLFPNKEGLSLLQICQAIHNSGLESEVKPPDYPIVNDKGEELGKFVSVEYLKKILNAYCAIGIPIILIISVPNGDRYGLHAVTVSGFKKSSPIVVNPKPEISWQSSNISKIYAHDDQWGPFARIEFTSDHELSTPWTVFDGENKPTYVTSIVVPVYPKMRISYEEIEVLVLGLDTILTLFFDGKSIADLVWDIHIDYSEKYKANLKSYSLDDNEKIKRLTKSLPKYLWVTDCYVGEYKIIELVFDATDVNQGMVGEDLICFLSDELRNQLVEFLKSNSEYLSQLFNHKSSTRYYDFFLNTLESGSDS